VANETITLKWDKPISYIVDRYAGPDTRKYMAVRARVYMEPYCPFKTGALASAQAEALEDGVLYNVPYARRFFYGQSRPKTVFHPLAGARWDLAMMKGAGGKKLLADIAAYIKRKG